MGLGRRETRLLLKEFISELNELIRAKSSRRHKKAKQVAFEFGKKNREKTLYRLKKERKAQEDIRRRNKKAFGFGKKERKLSSG